MADDTPPHPTPTLHWLPCSIAHDGPAPVGAYFQPKADGTRSAGLAVYEAAFRGRRLVGIHHPLPPGYRAYLLPPPPTDDAGMAIDAPPSSTSSRTFTATASWPGLISWALDAVPSAGDPARRALDWVGVAEACAGHIGAAAVTQALAMESYPAIARVAVPAVFINAAAPAVVALEMLLLARAAGGGDAAQAAFAATLSAVNLVSAATRFLVSGVSAQAGAAAARKRRSLLAARARVAVVAAAAIGLFAAGLLVAARRPAFTALGLSRSAADAAAPYWAWRAAAIPPALLAQAAQGVLQGCGWLGTAAGLAVLGSLAEAGAALVVLRPATVATSTTTHPPTRPLPALGRAALAVACLYAAAALAAAARAVACVPNTGGRGSRAASQASLNTPLVEGGGGGGGGEGAPPLLPSWRALASDFVSGSLAMFVRSITLQLTFFLGVVVASRRGTASLAAHGVVHTLWMLAAHALDGAETAATVLGCRVSALGEEEEGEDDEDCHLPPATRVATAAAAHARLTARCVGGSAVAGAAIGAAIQACSPQIITTFLRPGAKARDLLAGGPLSVLALAQVVNGPAYAMDGLLASLSLFGGGAVVILVGFVCVYAPLLACVAGSSSTQVIAGIWGAKLALNCVRVGGGLAVVKREWARRGVVAAGAAAVA